MNIREQLERREKQILSPFATFSDSSRGRRRAEDEHDIRMAFQRDRDRIIHCKSFRRLKHKTQVFLAPTGDHYRTRLTHTIEVAQIARTLARSLSLNEDLAEAIALGHDLGHTPFGHAGEEVLNELYEGGFEHYRQSLRVVDILENDGKGLNLTFEVRDGIVSHSKGRGDIFTGRAADKRSLSGPKSGIVRPRANKVARGTPKTPEGELVRAADVIAYTNHDLDDALRAGVLKITDVPKNILKTLGKTHSKRIDTMIRDIIRCSSSTCHSKRSEESLLEICMSDEIIEATYALRDFLFERVYEAPAIKKDSTKAKRIVAELYGYLVKNPAFLEKELARPMRFPLKREVVDFIAGMTDRYALNLYAQIFLPAPWPM